MPHDLQASLAAYRPYNEQEQRDLPLLLAALKQPDSFTRQNETAHFTASAWVVNPARNKVLMIYHNIYNSWSWTGGHADGETRKTRAICPLPPASQLHLSHRSR